MNEFLVWFVAFLISTSGVTYLYCKLTGTKFRVKLFIVIWVVVGSLGSAMLRIFNLTLLSTAFYFVFYPILFNFLNKSSFNKQFFYTVVVWFCGMLFDCLAMIGVLILNRFIEFNVYSPFSRIILTFIVLLAFVILANIKLFVQFVNKLYLKLQKVNYFDFTLMIFALFVLLMSVAIFLTLANIKLSILLLAVLFLLGFSFVLLIGVRINLIENAKFLKHLKENNDFYVTIEDENRIFKHNLMAKMLSIKSVSGKKARNLIDDFLKSYNANMDFSFHIKDMPYGLNGIIYEKIYPYMGQLNIKIDNKIDFDIFSKLKPRRYNVLVEKLMILLDNAIDSCLKSVDKILIINLYEDNNSINIEIKNTFSGDLDVEKLGESNYSTKGQKRGFGLYSALRNTEVSTKVNIVNNMFVVKLIAKNQS